MHVIISMKEHTNLHGHLYFLSCKTLEAIIIIEIMLIHSHLYFTTANNKINFNEVFLKCSITFPLGYKDYSEPSRLLKKLHLNVVSKVV